MSISGSTITESLAGRIDLITLWPLSVGELTGGRDDLVDRAFAHPGRLGDHRGATPSRGEYLDLLCAGGYPEPQRLIERSRRRWFERYVETVLRREVETTADLRRVDALFAMARLLVSTTGSELVVTRLAERLGIDRATAETYEPWIETTFLVHRLPAWAASSRDAVVEASDGRVLAIEVKSSTVARAADAAPMARLRDRLDRVGSDFIAGIVFHAGDRRVTLGDRMFGLPIADLWT